MATQQIGQDIEAYCGKCKDDTIHTITAMKDTDVDKAMCKVCMSYHKYKAAGTASSAPKAKPKTTRKPAKGRPMKTRRTKTAKLLEKASIDSAIAYKISSTYEAEEAINHKKFGLGIVKDVIDNQKITVLFEDGEKILVQNIN
jgi:ribosomal protein L44E